MKNKLKIITPVLVAAIILGIGGYSKALPNIDPLEIINKLNGNTTPQETPVENKTPKPTDSKFSIPISNPAETKPAVQEGSVQQNENISKNYMLVSPLQVVENPGFYLGKHIKFRAKFDKFTTLGLDYKPAMKSSEDYISVLIQRPDVVDHDIPLSELKIFMDRKEAEKHIDLNSGDEIEFAGTIFSKALGDAWMNLEKFTIIKSVPKTNNN